MSFRRIVMLSAIVLLMAVFSGRIQSRAPVPAAVLHQHGSHRSITHELGQRPQLLQTQQSGFGARSNLKLPLAVDGSRNPEKVPDRIAYSHFISFNAESATPTPSEINRRNASLDLFIYPRTTTAYLLIC